jgi:hypothetical protein
LTREIPELSTKLVATRHDAALGEVGHQGLGTSRAFFAGGEVHLSTSGIRMPRHPGRDLDKG